MSRLLCWFAVAVLVVDSMLLAAYQLLFLPLHLPRSLGGWSLPVSVLAAAVTMPLLVWATAGVAPRRSAALAPVIAWLLVVITLGAAGPGGDRALPADWRALLLVAVGMVCGGVAAGRMVVRQYQPVTNLPVTEAPATTRTGEVEDG